MHICPFILANSVDTDEMLQNAAFHLGLHCLPSNLFTDQQYKKGIRIRMDRNCLHPEFNYHYEHASCSIYSVVAELVTEYLAPRL